MKKLLLTVIASLVLSVSNFAQEYHFGDKETFYDPYDIAYMVIAFVQIDGEFVEVDDAYSNLEIACYVNQGTELRGFEFMTYYPEFGDPHPSVELPCACNFSLVGEPLTFVLYDHATGITYKTCTGNYDFVTGQDYDAIWAGEYDDAAVLNFTLSTIDLEISGWEEYTGEEPAGGYHLIATPVDNVNPGDVINMINADGTGFDLYTFDQDQVKEWVNCKPITSDFKLTKGTGYLYAHNTTVTLKFPDEPLEENEYTVTLTKGNDPNWAGWNLVGNSFTEAVNIDGYSFVRMNEAGDGYVNAEGQVNAMEAVFVVAEEDGETITFSRDSKNNVRPSLALTLRSGDHQVDNAIVHFDQGRQLPKMQFRQGSTQIYFTIDDKDYAVVNAGSMGELPIYFKAEKNGSFTLSFNAEEVVFSYLHLIDNMTGADVDLLETPSYSFDATTTDYASRFRLVFATGSSENESTFGFVNGSGNLCIFGIEGEATLQVFDVTGRMLSSEQFNGSYEKQLNVAPGVYVMRLLNGENVRTQKIVIR